MFLYIHELSHLLAGLIIGIIFYQIYKQKLLLIIPVITSFLIDADHLIDLWLYTSQNHVPFNPWLLFSDYFHQAGKIYLFFHSYEIILLLLIAGIFFVKYRKYLLAVSISMLVHIILDQLTYHPVFLEYFFVYRLINGFSVDTFN